MERFKKLVALLMVLSLTASTAFAGCQKGCGCKVKKTCECADKKVEAYAHPSFFMDENQTYTTEGDYNYVVGGKINKAANRMGFKNKESVYANAWAQDVLSLIKEKQMGEFNPKMPVLRSELAVILAEGFAVGQKPTKKYDDVSYEYWAASWIYKALGAGIMIGYPDNNFRPDQPVTKAEVFATIAQIIDVPFNNSGTPTYKGKAIQHIPTWANTPTREVAASNLLEQVPDQKKVVEDEYLSKEQVAYLVATLRQELAYGKNLGVDANAPQAIKDYKPICLKIKMNDRISAKHSNIGDRFTAKLLQAATVEGKSFPAGSEVSGEVVKVQRPGVNRCGFVQVKFNRVKDGDCKAYFPDKMSEARADVLKNPNIIARIVGAPFTGSARVVGVAGRTVGTGVNVIADRLEEFGDNFANIFVETLTLHPGSGIKSAGYSVVSLGKMLLDLGSLLVSGTFGIIYEIGDEILYTIVPSLSNDSSLNPNEELTILY